MQYGSGLARTGAATLVIGGVSFGTVWQVFAAVGLVVAGGLAVNISGRLRNRRSH